MENWNNMYMPGNKKINDQVNQPINNFRQEIKYYTCDGKELPSIEEVIMYNQMYYEKMKNPNQSNLENHSGMHR